MFNRVYRADVRHSYLLLNMINPVIVSALLVLAAAKPCEDHSLTRTLGQQLLSSLDHKNKLPNPSVHIALRLSTHHNLAKEREHLDRLKTEYHHEIEKSITNNKRVVVHHDDMTSLTSREQVVGRLALYIMALKSSCEDPQSLVFSFDNKNLIHHLKRELEEEKDLIKHDHHQSGTSYFNYYQYSLGILALCVSNDHVHPHSVRVNPHVSQKLIQAVEHKKSIGVDTLAMAGLALQCLKNTQTDVKDPAELDQALFTVKEKLLKARRDSGHIGNVFSTGKAVQALLALGGPEEDYHPSVEALKEDAKKGTYHNPMVISQMLPALQHSSLLALMNKECVDEDDTLVADSTPCGEVLQYQGNVSVQVEVIYLTGRTVVYDFTVPRGFTILKALERLQDEREDFTFITEDSTWGPFLSNVNGEQARMSDRRYFHLSADGKSLKEGIADYKIVKSQKISFRNTEY